MSDVLGSTRTHPRQRDVLPLPHVGCIRQIGDVGIRLDFLPEDLLLSFLNAMVRALNSLYGVSGLTYITACSSLQRLVLSRFVAKLERMCTRLSHVGPPVTAEQAFRRATGQTDDHIISAWSADSFDLLDSSGKVDPLPHVLPEDRGFLQEPSLMFPDPPDGLNSFSGIGREHRREYARLVSRQLQANKVDLETRVSAGAAIFLPGRKAVTSCVRFGMAPGYLQPRRGHQSQHIWRHQLLL